MKFIKPVTPDIDPQYPKNLYSGLKSAGFFLFQGQSLLLESGAVRALDYHELPAGLDEREYLYVGEMEGRKYYAYAVEKDLSSYRSVGLRSLLGEEQRFFRLAGRALQLVQWDENHRFCGRCGSLTQHGESEIVRSCNHCGLRAYPRLSPCVIMLVHRGDNILLAQRPGASSSWYTVQAGFIEAGESAEQAVAREVMEEAGLRLSSLRYFGSEPWPFPGQLMLGYIAESLEGELIPDLNELQNAAWFDYRNLPELPSLHSISGKLIRHFVTERTG